MKEESYVIFILCSFFFTLNLTNIEKTDKIHRHFYKSYKNKNYLLKKLTIKYGKFSILRQN